MPLQPGDILDERYRIESQLGQGGMATIFLGHDITLDIKVAVKENLNLNPESERQFHREARLLAALRHPNLPRVSDHFIVDNRQYLVMDYIEGIDLQERLAQQRPTVEEALAWGDAIADALHYLHTRKPPIIHRDIKPANLKLQEDGKIVLVDFGIAKVFDHSQTTTGARGLTPGFSPPEQYGGQRTDARSDQYALAATLYLLITNKRPTDSFQRVLGKETLTPIRLLHKGVPEHVAVALERALTLDQDGRFPDISTFRAALRSETAFKTIRVTMPASEKQKPSAAPKSKRRGRWISVGVGTGLIAIAALAYGLAVGFGGLMPGKEIPTPTSFPSVEPLATMERTLPSHAPSSSPPTPSLHPPPDQEQTAVDLGNQTVIGGSTSQRLAQVFTLTRSGYISHLALPLNCQPSAKVSIRIEEASGGVPSGATLTLEVVSGSQLTSLPTRGGSAAVSLPMVEFGDPLPVSAGTQYAFVLETTGGDCGVWWGPPGDTYPGGKAYFEASPNPPGWFEVLNPERDLAFQIFVSEGVVDG